MKTTILTLAFASIAIGLSTPAVAEESMSKYILTPKPSPEPRINGAKVLGVRPGNPFLFKVPATGTGPLHYAAEKLPEGLSIDRETGVITGKMDRAGTHVVDMVVSNSLGNARRGLTFLEQQPEVDPGRLGVTGHSMGGKITVNVAGIDKRVKAAVPLCGGAGSVSGKLSGYPGQQTAQRVLALVNERRSFEQRTRQLRQNDAGDLARLAGEQREMVLAEFRQRREEALAQGNEHLVRRWNTYFEDFPQETEIRRCIEEIDGEIHTINRPIECIIELRSEEAVAATAAQPEAVIPQYRTETAEHWITRHKQKLKERKQGDVDLVLIGDSITAYQVWWQTMEPVVSVTLGVAAIPPK